jgi:DNA-binding response OmpR family regulator
MGSGATRLDGLRVLVVEDTPLVADTIADVLDDIGCVVVGPVAELADAEALARGEALACALLDIRLGAFESFSVADVLRARGVPFAFLAGSADDTVPSDHRRAPRLGKPFTIAALLDVVMALLATPKAGGS